jgi:long-chain acyl-CoA synthetase
MAQRVDEWRWWRPREAGMRASEHRVDTLLEVVEQAAAAYGDRPLGVRLDDGTRPTGASDARSSQPRRLAPARLGLGRATRSGLGAMTPELAAVYFGAMRARVVFVPIDLRMSADAIQAIAAKSGARRLVVGSGRGAPVPRDVGMEAFPCATVESLTADPDGDLPADWHELVRGWERRGRGLFQLIFTSGTTGTPKGVMLAHDNMLASIRAFNRIIPPLEHRLVSLMPLSHLLEQSVGLYYCLGLGADTVYVGSRHPRVIFDTFREHRVTTMIVAPQILDLFWRSIEHEAEKAGRARQFAVLRLIARPLPITWRRRIFRSIHERLGGQFRLFVSAGSFLPPAIQQAWQDIGVIVLQGYGTTETGTGACQTLEDHGLGTVGRPPEGVEMRLAADGEVEFRGPMLCRALSGSGPPRRSRETAGSGPATSVTSMAAGG